MPLFYVWIMLHMNAKVQVPAAKASKEDDVIPNTGPNDDAPLELEAFCLAGRVPLGAEVPVPSTTVEGVGEPKKGKTLFK